MASIVVRDLPDETHRALKARAARHGRSMEAEVRDILGAAVSDRVRLGSLLLSIAADASEQDDGPDAALETSMTTQPHEPLDLSE